MPTPKISVVTCSFNQGKFIRRTIESVFSQDYTNWEHIVVDGMSSDETAQILSHYPHLRVIREPDQGQADAINKGFRLATGEIFCFLNSDDTFTSGALARVAREIDPAKGKHIVMGRCRFIDEDDRFTGIEHPSFFESHRRVLETWKGHCLPQPAVFWTREVWESCGPLKTEEHLLLDYDLFCRFSKRYAFHFVDQVLANYRLQSESKTSSVNDAQRMERSVTVSRRYWGSPLTLQFWLIQLSYSLYRLDRKRRAANMLRRGRDAFKLRQYGRTFKFIGAGILIGPEVVFSIGMPLLAVRLSQLLGVRLNPPRLVPNLQLNPQTLAWRDFTSQHKDGWLGPVFEGQVEVGVQHTHLQIQGACWEGQMSLPFEIEVLIDGISLGKQVAPQKSSFELRYSLVGIAPGLHQAKVVSDSYFVPHNHFSNNDYRPLSFRLVKLEPQSAEGFTAPYADGWFGPKTVMNVKVHSRALVLKFEGFLGEIPLPQPLEVEIRIDGKTVGTVSAGREKAIRLVKALPAIAPGPHRLEFICNAFVIPDEHIGNGDTRRLSFILSKLSIK